MMPTIFSRKSRSRKKQLKEIEKELKDKKPHIATALIPPVVFTAVPSTPPNGVGTVRQRSSSAPPTVSVGTQSSFPVSRQEDSDLPSVTSGLSEHSSDEDLLQSNVFKHSTTAAGTAPHPYAKRPNKHLVHHGHHGLHLHGNQHSHLHSNDHSYIHSNYYIQDPSTPEEGDLSSEVGQPHPHFNPVLSEKYRKNQTLNLGAYSLTPQVARSSELRSTQPGPQHLSPAGMVHISPVETVHTGGVMLLKETKPDGSVSYFAASPVPTTEGMSRSPTTPPLGWGQGETPTDHDMMSEFHPTPLGQRSTPQFTSTPAVQGGGTRIPPAVQGGGTRGTHKVQGEKCSHVTPQSHGRGVQTCQNPSKPLKNKQVDGNDGPVLEAESSISQTSSCVLSLSASTILEDNRHSNKLDDIHETYKHVIEKMEARSDDLHTSLKVVSAKNAELLTENTSLKVKQNKMNMMEERLKKIKEERNRLEESLREQAQSVTVKEQECAQLHNEVKRLKRKNNACAKELSRTRELLQTDQSLIGRRVAEEVDGVKVEKEKLEEHCRELQRANSKLQNKVDELLKTTARSISLQDHKAALDEIQGMVELFKADAESSKDELVHRIKVLEKEKKQLLNQLSEGEIAVSQLEQKCVFLEEAAAESNGRISQLEMELESSRDRETMVHAQLSKAVSQAERALGERESLSSLLKSHRELTATKYAQYKEKIHRLQKQLQTHKESSFKYIQEASEVLDHQSKEQKALRKRYESELTHLNKTVQKKQTEVDELSRDKRKLAEQLRRTQLQAARS